jgi:hypothetical protein
MKQHANVVSGTLWVIILMSLAGCNIGKRIVGNDTKMPLADPLIREVYEANSPSFGSDIRFTGKATLDDEKISFIGNAKILRDSLIWVSLRSTFGIEIGRMVARRDSIWIVSKMLKIKEKGNWKIVNEITGYGLDFNALQGILTQSLFTAGGNSKAVILGDMLSRKQNDKFLIGWKKEIEDDPVKSIYLTQFDISPVNKKIEHIQMKDGKGQWITKVDFEYTREGKVRKILINGIDETRSYNTEITIITVDLNGSMSINFEYF